MSCWGMAAIVNGRRFDMLNAHTVFPAASLVKIPVLIHYLVSGGLQQEVVVDGRGAPDGSGALRHISRPVRMTLQDALTIMVCHSDNVAANWLMERASLAAINRTLREYGYTATRVTHYIRDWDTLTQPSSNPTTPAEMSQMLYALAHDEIPRADIGLAMLYDQQYRSRIPLYIRDNAGVRIANKTGTLPGAVHDVAYVQTASHLEYSLACLSQKQRSNGEAATYIARFARLWHTVLVQGLKCGG